MRFKLLIILLLVSSGLQAQVFNPWGPPPNDQDIQPNFFRKVLNMFSAEVGVGYGSTRYRQNLDAYSILSKNNTLYLGGVDSAGNQVFVQNWINQPQFIDSVNASNTALYDPANRELDSNQDYLIADGERRLTGGGAAIPMHIKLTFNYKRFRVGGGATFEFNSNANLGLRGFPQEINRYETNTGWFNTTKYYLTAGGRYYDFWDYSFFADVEYGRFNVSNRAFPLATESSYWNISLPIEKNLSEYFRLVLRPSIDLKSIAAPVGQQTIKTNLHNIQLQVGIRVSFPLFKKCPISNCEAQKEHIHVDKKFRGQPIYKKQNPKVGELYPELQTRKSGIFNFLKP